VVFDFLTFGIDPQFITTISCNFQILTNNNKTKKPNPSFATRLIGDLFILKIQKLIIAKYML